MATVLVVEDDKLSQRILSKMLAGGNHTALVASSVEEAWTVLRQNVSFDLVILDNQLGREWGWKFVERLREDVLYQDLPVVVYTGHTERNSILRYVELGVKSMLVKPYKAEIVFEEVAKAIKTDWSSKLLERAEVACQRLKISENDYYTVLSAGASSLEQNVAELRRLFAGRPDDGKIRDAIQQLHTQSASLGMPALRTVTETLARAVAARNGTLIQNCLQAIDSLKTLLRNRTLAYVGIENVAPKTKASRRTAEVDRGVEAAAGASSGPTELFRRRTAAAPIWKFNREFERLTAARLFPVDELAELTAQFLGQPTCVELLDTVRFLNGAAQSAAVDDLVAQINRTPSLEKLFAHIAERAGGQIEVDVDTMKVDLEQLVNRLGIHKTILLLGAHRLDQALRRPSLLDLSWLRKQTILSLLLSYEIARMLNSEDDLLVSAVGAVHQIGSWCFATCEPGLYAVALARAEGDVSIEAAEKTLFGQSHGEVGFILLTKAGFKPEFSRFPMLVSASDEVETNDPLTLACVRLAAAFAWSAIAQDAAHSQALRARLLAPADPIWALLRTTRTELPMDLPEFIETLEAAAQSCLSILSALNSS